MGRKRKRDIYKGRGDEGFDLEKDIDLAHLRTLMTTETLSYSDNEYYGIYCRNIAKIMLNSGKFVGYPPSLKEEIEGNAILKMLTARVHFDDKYDAPSAPFNYLYRCAYNSCLKTIMAYYKMQDKMIPVSELPNGAHRSDGTTMEIDYFDSAITDWDEIADHLRYAPKRTSADARK